MDSPAKIAREMLAKRGVTEAMLRAYDYPCSDHCGPGPRFILRPPQGTAVCMNIGEFRARFRKVKPDVHGDVLAKYMVSDKGLDLASILKPQKHSWRGRKADCKCRHCGMVRSFDSTTKAWTYRLDDKEIGVYRPDYTGKFDEPKCAPSDGS